MSARRFIAVAACVALAVALPRYRRRTLSRSQAEALAVSRDAVAGQLMVEWPDLPVAEALRVADDAPGGLPTVSRRRQ